MVLLGGIVSSSPLRPDVWFDAGDRTTLRTVNDQPVSADGDVLTRWRSRGTHPDYDLTPTTGSAVSAGRGRRPAPPRTVRPCSVPTPASRSPTSGGFPRPFNGRRMAAETGQGTFSNVNITGDQPSGLTLFLVLSNFRGEPGSDNGAFWHQATTNQLCAFRHPYNPGNVDWYETMGAADVTKPRRLWFGGYAESQFPVGRMLYAVRADSGTNNDRRAFRAKHNGTGRRHPGLRERSREPARRVRRHVRVRFPRGGSGGRRPVSLSV